METKSNQPSRSQTLICRLDEFMRERYLFRHNILKGDIEYCDREQTKAPFEPVTETTINTVCIEAQTSGIDAWDRDIKRFIYSARTPVFNPLDHYLNQLPPWDGTDRIRPLARLLPTAHTHWPDQFYTWFLGMVAQWKQMDTMYGNCVVPLLSGPQGCGKSTWCRRLLPAQLREYMAESLDFGNRREAELALGRFALINLDEFDSIKASQQAFLKYLLQKPDVNTRLPHARSIRYGRRYCTFIATCNHLDLLTDPTGSRRFICIEINGTICNSHTIEHDQLYAQALSALRQGERYWFTQEEEAANMQENRRFQQMPLEEQLFLQYYRKPEYGESGEWLSSSEILLNVRKLSGVKFGNVHMSRFGRILQQYKIPHRHTNRGNVWQIMPAAQEEPQVKE